MKRIEIDDQNLDRLARAIAESGFVKEEDAEHPGRIKAALQEILTELNSPAQRRRVA